MSKFDFNEIVKLVSSDPELSEVNGKEGVVRGMAEENNVCVYAVNFDGFCWSIDEKDLISLNRFAKEEDFYTGESMKVVVTADGKGRIKKD
ncbi:MAG: Imm31 family immunity protein [Gammaproteobacteria bacterium]